MRRHSRSRGFSLIELLVSVGILGIVMAYVFETFTSQHQTYIVVDQLSETQQKARNISALLEADLRVAGYLVPDVGGVCGWDSTTAPDTLFVSNAEVIQTVDAVPNSVLRGTYESRVVGGSIAGGAVGWTASGTAALTLTNTYVDEAAGGADFAVGGGLILVDRNDASGRVACGIITAVAGNVVSVNLGTTSVAAVTTAGGVVAIPAHVYRITGTPPQLFRNGVLIGDHVEDLQIAYFFDADGDRDVDPGEYVGDDEAYNPGAIDGSLLREVRANLIVTTASEDPREEWDRGIGQGTENRTVASLAGQDGLRRRVHTTTVRVRNVGND